MDNEIAALIKEIEKEEEFDKIVTEVTVPFASDSDAEEIVEIEIPEEELMEDDVLVADIDINSFFKVGDTVQLIPNAKFAAGGTIPAHLFGIKLYVRDIRDGKYSISPRSSGRMAGSVHPSSLRTYVEKPANEEHLLVEEEIFKPYYVIIDAEQLTVRSKPIDNSKNLKTIYKDDLYTVVGEKNGWGHLKIGGWIPLDKTHIITPIKI